PCSKATCASRNLNRQGGNMITFAAPSNANVSGDNLHGASLLTGCTPAVERVWLGGCRSRRGAASTSKEAKAFRDEGGCRSRRGAASTSSSFCAPGPGAG